MRIAIVGAGRTGLSAARHLAEDPRHVITVFETRAWLGGDLDERAIADSIAYLSRLGVTLRRTAQVERLAVDDTGADLWINGLADRFELALVTTSPAEAQALLVRSGIRRKGGSMPLGRRVYFAERGPVGPDGSACAALARIAADHPGVRPEPDSHPPLGPPRGVRCPNALRSLARRAGGLRTAHVQYLDLSGRVWPLGSPAVYIANHRWLLDVVPRHLMIRGLWTPEASDETNAMDIPTIRELEAGTSVSFVVEGGTLPRRAADASHGRGAALVALGVNAPIVPIVARALPASTSPMRLRRRRKGLCVVIGEPFYPETSSIDELMEDMRMVVRHLEQLADRESSASPRSSRRGRAAGQIGPLLR